MVASRNDQRSALFSYRPGLDAPKLVLELPGDAVAFDIAGGFGFVGCRVVGDVEQPAIRIEVISPEASKRASFAMLHGREASLLDLTLVPCLLHDLV